MSHLLLTILLAPVLLIQGILVRKNMPILPEPPGPRKGTKGTGRRISILILGDSAAAGVGADHQNNALLGQLVDELAEYFCVSWQLEANTGATTDCAINRLKNLEENQFDIVLTSLGVNDITSNVSITKWMRQQNALQEKCFKTLNSQLIITTALPPVGKFPALPQPLRWYLGRRSNQFNQALEKQVSHKNNVHFLYIGLLDDLKAMATDGFHPGAKVYQQWALKAAAKIKSEFLNSTSIY